jgi:hypothetical protein
MVPDTIFLWGANESFLRFSQADIFLALGALLCARRWRID